MVFGDRCHAGVVELRFGRLDERDFRREGLHEGHAGARERPFQAEKDLNIFKTFSAPHYKGLGPRRCHAGVVELRFGRLDERDFRREGLHEGHAGARERPFQAGP